MNSLGIYIQVPFCASKCSFCNFSSRVAPERVFDGYTSALLSEIQKLRDLYSAKGVAPDILDFEAATAYMGGGTPTLLGWERLEQIIAALRGHFNAREIAEFTIEVTPASAEGELLRMLRSLGVNRLSIGAQSFNDRELRSVGRLHSADETRQMFREARRAGFKNTSLDLIAGLPHQDETSWQATVEEALALEPEHISVYLFEVDEKSRLGREVLQAGRHYHADTLPDEDFMADAYEWARQRLREAGYRHYEISNFARPGFESRHNLKYWRLEPYVGLGAGAHSFDGQHRWANEANADLYTQHLENGETPIAEFHKLTHDERVEEFFFLGLRETQGLDLKAAKSQWGESGIAPWVGRIEELERAGLLEQQDDRVRLTEKAYLVSNEVFAAFVGA